MENLLETLCIGGILAGGAIANAFDKTLNWNPPTNYIPHGYVVSWGNVPRDFSYGEYLNNVNVGDTNSWDITNLVSGSAYYAAVKCYSQFGQSGYSNELLLQDTNAVNISAPPGFSAVLNSVNTNNPPYYQASFSFSWGHVDGANGYHISYFRKYERPVSFYAGNEGNIVSNIPAPLTGTEYYFGIVATNQQLQLNGPISMVTNSTPCIVGLPLPPPKISISGITNLNGPDAYGALVSLNWVPCPNRDPRNIEYIFYTKYGPNVWEFFNTGQATNCSTLYFPNSYFEGWRVVAYDKINDLYSQPSEPISGNTSYPAGYPMMPPSNLKLKIN